MSRDAQARAYIRSMGPEDLSETLLMLARRVTDWGDLWPTLEELRAKACFDLADAAEKSGDTEAEIRHTITWLRWVEGWTEDQAGLRIEVEGRIAGAIPAEECLVGARIVRHG